MTKYLYGAAVQGIQGFIFQTNELKDIVGASELVEQICTDAFTEFVGKGELVLHAAGNIKCVYSNEAECKRAVLEFPRKVMEMAPGITISQAVVTYEDNNDPESKAFGIAVDKLEECLKAQRNKPMKSLTQGLIGIKRSNKTGKPAVCIKDNDYIDASTFSKRYVTDKKRNVNKKSSTNKLAIKAFGLCEENPNVAHYIEDMTEKNDWIAVIHVDGNGVGQVVQKVGKEQDKFKEFSINLKDATNRACKEAFNDISKKYKFSDKNGSMIIPIRPVILGGDDLTVICRADMAVDFTEAFMNHFEKYTKQLLSSQLLNPPVFEGGADHLTACAGIAFMKSSYPFYYGYDLAESLCSEAKKEAKSDKFVKANKGLAPSCLMFHKIQDSFTEDYRAICRRELTPYKGHSWMFGPYYMDRELAVNLGRWSIHELNTRVGKLQGKEDQETNQGKEGEETYKDKKGNEANAVKSHLRQWMSLMHKNPEEAKIKRLRVISMLSSKSELKKLVETVTAGESRNKVQCYPVYDMLALHSIMCQETKKHTEDE